jgi:hypothetical protein
MNGSNERIAFALADSFLTEGASLKAVKSEYLQFGLFLCSSVHDDSRSTD